MSWASIPRLLPLREALLVETQVRGLEDKITLRTVDNLVYSLAAQNEIAEAGKIACETLEAVRKQRRRVVGEQQHPDATLAGLDYLAEVAQCLKQQAAAAAGGGAKKRRRKLR